MVKTLIIEILIFTFFIPDFATASINPKTLHVVQIVDHTPGSYVSSIELKEITTGAQLAIEDFRRNQKCDFSTDFELHIGEAESLYNKVKSITRTPGKNVIIGVSRTSYSRLAAKAAAGSSVTGISIGAAATDLSSINPNFFSVAPPWTLQWQLVQEELKASHCSKDHSLGIFDSTDSYSLNFKKAFQESGFPFLYEVNSPDITQNLGQLAKNHRCVFLGMNFSSSHGIMSQLVAHSWKGTILGTGDWYYFSKELKILLPKLKTSGIQAASPTTWNWSSTPVMTGFIRRFERQMGRKPDPVAGFTYEATTLGLFHLCGMTNLKAISKYEMSKLPLLRKYSGFLPSGNLNGSATIIRFNEVGAQNATLVTHD
jgi:hypothetical protein